LTVIAGLLVVGALWWARPLLIPIVVGVLASYALDPIQRRLTSWGVPRAAAATLILVSVAAALGGAAIGLRNQVSTFAAQLPVVTQQVRQIFENGRGSRDTAVAQVQQAAEDLKRAADASSAPLARNVTRVQVEEPAIRVSDLLWRGSLGAATLAGQAAISFFLLFYLLATGDLYKRKIARLAGPSLSQRRITVEILSDITEQIERFLLMRLLISAIVGVSTGLAFSAMGVAEPILWGIAAGVLNTIPYFGPTVVAIAAAVGGLAQFGTVGMSLAMGGVATAIAAIDGFVVQPWLLGRASRMNAGAVFLGLAFWGWLWGSLGMLLAVPILISIKAVCDHVDAWRPFGELLSE
jgi:predicted PurR-regulated permease PerM